MTTEQWLALKVGDEIIDHRCGDQRRVVLTIKRITGTRGQGVGRVRTCITATNLKSRFGKTYINSTDDIGGGTRFELATTEAT